METIAVVLVICAAAGYLIRRYLKKGRNVGGCSCDDLACPLKVSGPAAIKDGCHQMVCEDEKLKSAHDRCCASPEKEGRDADS